MCCCCSLLTRQRCWRNIDFLQKLHFITSTITKNEIAEFSWNWVELPSTPFNNPLTEGGAWAVWPDLAIYWTLGKFLKSLAPIYFPEAPTFLGNFCNGVKIFQVKSFLGNFYRHLAIFIWSHWAWVWPDLSLFERSWRQITSQKWPKIRQLLGRLQIGPLLKQVFGQL